MGKEVPLVVPDIKYNLYCSGHIGLTFTMFRRLSALASNLGFPKTAVRVIKETTTIYVPAIPRDKLNKIIGRHHARVKIEDYSGEAPEGDSVEDLYDAVLVELESLETENIQLKADRGILNSEKIELEYLAKIAKLERVRDGIINDKDRQAETHRLKVQSLEERLKTAEDAKKRAEMRLDEVYDLNAGDVQAESFYENDLALLENISEDMRQSMRLLENKLEELDKISSEKAFSLLPTISSGEPKDRILNNIFKELIGSSYDTLKPYVEEYLKGNTNYLEQLKQESQEAEKEINYAGKILADKNAPPLIKNSVSSIDMGALKIKAGAYIKLEDTAGKAKAIEENYNTLQEIANSIEEQNIPILITTEKNKKSYNLAVHIPIGGEGPISQSLIDHTKSIVGDCKEEPVGNMPGLIKIVCELKGQDEDKVYSKRKEIVDKLKAEQENTLFRKLGYKIDTVRTVREH